MGKKIYVSGKVSGILPFRCNYAFGYATTKLKEAGNIVINPIEVVKPFEASSFDYESIIKICLATIDVCDAIYMLDGWQKSNGARREHSYALEHGKELLYQSSKEVE